MSRYTSLAFIDALKESGIAGSIGIGDALENVFADSAIGLCETGLIVTDGPCRS